MVTIPPRARGASLLVTKVESKLIGAPSARKIDDALTDVKPGTASGGARWDLV
jgi:hypothetical protein